MNIYDVVRKPLVSEKTTLEKDAKNIVAFVVHRDANKIEIKAAVEQLLKVEVVNVNTVNVAARSSGSARTWGNVPTGKRPM